MIKYNLKCKNNHEFESWFSNSNEFEKLNRKNLLECIYCSTNKIKKSIMAPMIAGVKSKKGNFYRRQDIPKVYLYNGAIYIIKVDSMIKNRNLNFKNVKKYLMDWKSSIDIDTEEQLQYAEFIKKKYKI